MINDIKGEYIYKKNPMQFVSMFNKVIISK